MTDAICSNLLGRRRRATEIVDGAVMDGSSPKAHRRQHAFGGGEVKSFGKYGGLGVKKDKDGKKILSDKQAEKLLADLQARFEDNMARHEGMAWSKVQVRLATHPEKLWSLHEMERSGGEPDLVGFDKKTGEYIFYDCSAESPKGRRSLCYDRAGQEAREKEGLHPGGNVIDMAASMGIEPLTEDQYRDLQKLGDFDLKTQSWVMTPADIRKLGGALFMDRRFDHVFLYHNTAPCFYGNRAFRGALKV